MQHEHFSRPFALSLLQQRIERDSFPRLQMFFLVALTGGSGLLASFLMLNAGIEDMWLRYPLALAAAYLFFLLLLWLWLRSNAEDYVDIPDLTNFDLGAKTTDTANCTEPFSGGHGGDFGGGGASGSYESPASFDVTTSDTTSSVTDALGSVAEADEFAIPLVIILIGIGIALSSFYIIYSAPVLFAELLLDGVLSVTLYRQLRGLERRHWLESAIRRTVIPVVLTGIFLIGAGLLMKHYAPHAHSIGAFVHHTGS